MAKTNDIIFCLRATNVNGEGASASTILTSITPEYIPGLFSFSIIVTIVDIELDKNHKTRFEFLSPSSDTIIKIDADLPELPDESNLPNEYKGLTAAMDWNNVDFKSSGLYTLNVYIDEQLVGSKQIFVKGKNE